MSVVCVCWWFSLFTAKVWILFWCNTSAEVFQCLHDIAYNDILGLNSIFFLFFSSVDGRKLTHPFSSHQQSILNHRTGTEKTFSTSTAQRKTHHIYVSGDIVHCLRDENFYLFLSSQTTHDISSFVCGYSLPVLGLGSKSCGK
jgi:hypothetical protein